MTQSADQLAQNLAKSDLEAQRAAAEQLSQLGEAAASAAPLLAQAAGSDDEVLREYAVAALEGLGRPLPDQLAELESLLSSKSDDTVYWGATLLGRLGAEAANSTPALVAVLNDHSSLAARERAASALGQIGSSDPKALAALTAASKDSAPRLARVAAQALEAVGGE